MNVLLGDHVTGRRLVELLGGWYAPGSRPGSAALAGAIRRLVTDGRLAAGTRLPAQRELAEALGVSRTLVNAALEAMRADGLVASRRGSGSWVRLPAIGTAEHPDDVSPRLIDLVRASPAAPPGLFAAYEAARAAVPALFPGHGYSPRGLAVLRERIAESYTARGLPTGPEHILITGGAQAAFVLALGAMTRPGDRVLVEQPSYVNALRAIGFAHTTAVPVAVRDGWNPDGIAAALRQASPALAYLIPEFHNPTGHRMPAEVRERVAAELRRTHTMAVADETLVEIDYTGRPTDGPPPLAAFAPRNVLSVGSASKSHWGGLRIGWLRAETELLDALFARRAVLDLGSPVLEQLALADLLAHHQSDVDERRREFARRRDVLVGALREECPSWTFTVPDGGLCLWCELDAPMSSRLAVVAEDFGLRVAPGAAFGTHGGLERMLRVPFVLDEDTLRDAAARLARAAAATANRPAGGLQIS